MPFTPFHSGPGLLVKGLIPNHFSFSTFALANIAMDIEPLYRMWRVETPLHGYSHTLAGAVLIATGTALLGRPVLKSGWKIYERISAAPDVTYRLTWIQAITGAFIGTGSHLILDALIHADMHPFAPLAYANPLLNQEWIMPLHLACLLSAMLGMALVLARSAMNSSTSDKDEYQNMHLSARG